MARRSLRGFAQRMREGAGVIGGAVNEIKKQTATTILENLVEATPLDTGEAVNNWQITHGGAPKYKPGPKQRTGKNGKPARVTKSDINGRNNLQYQKAVIAKTQPRQPIHIANAAPHIGALNAGHSRQAPAGFIEKAVLDGKQQVQKAADRILKKALSK